MLAESTSDAVTNFVILSSLEWANKAYSNLGVCRYNVSLVCTATNKADNKDTLLKARSRISKAATN